VCFVAASNTIPLILILLKLELNPGCAGAEIENKIIDKIEKQIIFIYINKVN
jgi:hypothetical protein